MVLFGFVPLFLRIDSPEFFVEMLEIDSESFHLLENELESFQNGVELVLPEHDNLLVLHVLLLLSFLSFLVLLLRLQVLLVLMFSIVAHFHLICLIAEPHLCLWSFCFISYYWGWGQLQPWLSWDWTCNYLMLLGYWECRSNVVLSELRTLGVISLWERARMYYWLSEWLGRPCDVHATLLQSWIKRWSCSHKI